MTLAGILGSTARLFPTEWVQILTPSYNTSLIFPNLGALAREQRDILLLGCYEGHEIHNRTSSMLPTNCSVSLKKQFLPRDSLRAGPAARSQAQAFSCSPFWYHTQGWFFFSLTSRSSHPLHAVSSFLYTKEIRTLHKLSRNRVLNPYLLLSYLWMFLSLSKFCQQAAWNRIQCWECYQMAVYSGHEIKGVCQCSCLTRGLLEIISIQLLMTW